MQEGPKGELVIARCWGREALSRAGLADDTTGPAL
jgi:hypothetical protein